VTRLLETLSPTERAAYVLREAFAYPYKGIANVLALSESNARQVVARARSRLCSERRRPVSAADQQRFLDAFLAAAQTGALAPLERILTADVVTRSDGGKATITVRTPCVGRANDSSLPAAIAA
jgi:RNA polymerase sigma-70 factor, ECF subfamily